MLIPKKYRQAHMSYLQIKAFVDEQIKILNTPVTIDENIKQLIQQENLTEAQVKSILFKCNLLIKRHNRTKYNKQVVHQIVQQVTKAEQANLVQANEALSKISRLVQPVMTDQFSSSGRLQDRLRLLNDLADILPEGRYLFAVGEDGENLEKSPDLVTPEVADTEDNPLIRDNEELLQSAEDTALRNQYIKAAQEETEKQFGAHREKRAELRQRYDELRVRLAQINEDVVYKMEKLAYLRQLSQKMDFSSIGNGEEELGLSTQMSRFSVLVEKLEFALTPGE